VMARRMTGLQAFERAKLSAGLSATGSLQAADALVANRLSELQSDGEQKELRRAGGRLLVRRDGIWTDVAERDSARIKSIAPFTAAYFALIRARPSLRAALAVGTPVLLAGRGISLKVADGGATEWAPGELERFLQEFEGR